MEALEVLPPMGWKGSAFYMSEFSFDDITAKYTRQGDHYYCEFARYPERAKPVVDTPWGASQHTLDIAPGITRYDTASHGGYYLSPERVAQMPKSLQAFKTWASGNWYEEDCDWSVVALAFPHFFDVEAKSIALRTLKNYRPEVYEAFIAEVAGTKPAQGGGRGV